MTATSLNRGFPTDRLKSLREPKVKCDDGGHYIMTLSENIKVYFEDYYQFLDHLLERCEDEAVRVDAELTGCDDRHAETLSYFRARKIVVEVAIKTIRSFYTDAHNLGVIMTPWCFGTVVLEKVEMYRDRIAKGDVQRDDLGDYPFDVAKYIDEIRQTTLMEMLDLPQKAFAMRWQYTEMIKRYSNVLNNVTNSLQGILHLVKNYGNK